MVFRGSVALVTGAASGIGQLTARRLAAAGVSVAAIDVDGEGLGRTAHRAPTIRTWQVDVSDLDEVTRVVGEVESELGPIDRVTNCAAVGPAGPVLEQDPDEVRRVIEVNYLGTVHVTRSTLPAMLERGRGDLVNYASLAGWLPTPGLGAYSASKFAVVAFTETLAHENEGRGVRFACVCPPPVDTPLLSQIADGAHHVLDAAPPIKAEVVVDAVEDALDRGQLFVFPGPGTRLTWTLRRLVPGVVWQELQRAARGEPGPLTRLVQRGQESERWEGGRLRDAAG